MKRFVVIVITFLLCFNLVSAQARKQPLPALPDEAILNSIIAQTSGVPFTPLGAPSHVMQQLGTFGAPFENIASMIDTQQAVSYFSTQNQLLETIIPLVANSSATLAPDMTAPGAKPKPGKIVGVMFQPSRGAMIMVATFKKNRPHKLRLYTSATQYDEVSLDRTKFKGKNAHSPLDEGAVIAVRYSCVTVGKQQVCWKAENRQRDVSTVKTQTRDAYKELKAIYDFKMKFNKGDSIADMVGLSRRAECAAAFASATDFSSIEACGPNVLMMGAKEMVAGEPIGIFSVTEPADMKTYRASDGAFVGQLPAGNYLVMDATPSISQPGSVGVLMLVNADTVNHYLIPVMTMQGFGKCPVMVKPAVAIKDGFVWGKGFGY